LLVEHFVAGGGRVGATIDVSGAPAFGFTALHLLAQKQGRGSEREEAACALARVLLAHGAPADAFSSRGRTPLAMALNSGQIRLACLLVELGADPDAPDGRGQTVWQVCRQHWSACLALQRHMARSLSSGGTTHAR
jgi:ankyrin repeat protein